MTDLSDLSTLDAQIATQEFAVSGLRPDCEKRIVWHGAPGVQTGWAVIYVHGFSASPQEIRPVPDRVAAALGANLFFARLTGHGQDGDAMANATLADWQRDVDQALRIGSLIGKRVLVMGCSTGSALLTMAGAAGAPIAGYIHVSPNFGLKVKWMQRILDAPVLRSWVPKYGGNNRGLDRVIGQVSAEYAAYFTTSYPVQALYPMTDAVKAVWRADVAAITAPALVLYAESDLVVSPGRMHKMMARWGGDVTKRALNVNRLTNPASHIITGDIVAPDQTDTSVQIILDWAKRVL